MNGYVKIDLIKNFIVNNGYSKVRFCKACKISPVTLNEILDGKIKITPLTKIARLMELNLFDLLVGE